MSAPPENLAESVAHRHIDTSGYERVYVVGDIHGCRETFERLLTELGFGADDLIVSVGDLVRKGPDSAGVLDIVRRRENVHSVRGNNEQHLIEGRKSHPDHDAEDVAFMRSLPVAITLDDALVVHGGVNHRKPLSAHDPADLLTMRSLADSGGYDRPFWFEARGETPRVFFGHTVLAEPFESPYAVGLDTGCVYGGRLTAYDLRAGEFVGVTPPETYRRRSKDSVVTPRDHDSGQVA